VRAARREVIAALVTCLTAGVAQARVLFPSVTERALGVGPAAVRDPTPGNAPQMCIEVADAELFGIAGLRASGARGTVRTGPCRVGVEITQIAAPVGSQTRVAADIGYASPSRWSAALRVGTERLVLDGVDGEAAVVAGVLSSADLGPATVLAEVESIGDGDAREIWMRLATVARAGTIARIVTSARVATPGGAALGVGVRAVLHPALSLLAGYDDGAETLSAGVAVAVRRWELSAGVFRHAVLGLSQSVSLVGSW